MKILKNTALWAYGIFITLGILFFVTAPRTVQTGDSGEFALVALKGLVPHPSGYPLWVWLNRAWLQIFRIDNVYFSLSLFSIIVSLVVLAAVYRLFKNKLLGLFVVISIALGMYFWRYTITPEVFSLHLLICSLMMLFAFKEEETVVKSSSVFAVPFLFFLGAANHLTIIFMLPLLLWFFWKHRARPAFYLGTILGVIVCAGLYASLLLLDTKNLYSWGDLQGIEDVFNHFMRSDYGTTRLMKTDKDVGVLPIYAYFFRQLLKSSWPLFVILAAVIWRKQRRFQVKTIYWPVFACFFLYLFFFMGTGQGAPTGFYSEILQRFFLMPIFLLAVFIGKWCDTNVHPKQYERYLRALVLLLLACLIEINFSTANLSRNAVIEDFAVNVLNTVHGKKPLLFMHGDTELAATRFVQQFHRINPDVPVVAETLMSYSWLNERMKKIYPDFKVDAEGIHRKNSFAPIQDIVGPNADNFDIYSTWDFYRPTIAHITYFPSARLVKNGMGADFQKDGYIPKFRTDIRSVPASDREFNPYRSIYANYGFYFLEAAAAQFQNKNAEVSLSMLEKVYDMIPYCVPALEAICQVKGSQKLSDPRCAALPDKIKDIYSYFPSRDGFYYSTK